MGGELYIHKQNNSISYTKKIAITPIGKCLILQNWLIFYGPGSPTNNY